MIKLISIRPILLTGVFLLCAMIGKSVCAQGGNENGDKKSGGSAAGVMSLSASGKESGKVTEKKQKPYDIVKDLPDDAVLLKVGDDDVLKWGEMRDYVDAMVGMKLTTLFGAAAKEADEMSEIRIGLYGASLTKLLKGYVMTSLVAHEARKENLQISEKEIAVDLDSFRKRTRKLFTFQYQWATNLVYQRAYIDKHIRPNISVTDDEIKTLIKWRHDSNLSVPKTNALYRAQIENLRKQIADGTLEFAEAAEKYSDCTECCSNNGDCGPWEEDLDDLDPALKAYCFSAPTNVLSGVIEGNEAFHVVKVVSRYVPTKKAREEDGEVSSVEVKHLQIDKWLLDPEFTKETAIEFISRKKVAFELSKVQDELLKSAKIESVLPLYDTRKKKPKTLIVK